MSKLKIIARLWSHITDLRMLARGQSRKTLEQIEKELELTESFCIPYADEEEQ